jgi:hypothetical protein
MRRPRHKPWKFLVRVAIGKRLGKGSRYSLVEVCVHLVDRYGLREEELATIFTLQPGETFTNEDLSIRKLQ